MFVLRVKRPARVYLLQRGKGHLYTQLIHIDARVQYKILLRECLYWRLHDPCVSDRETWGSLRLLFTSAYNAISFYFAPLPLCVIVCVRIMSTAGAAQQEEKNFMPFPTFFADIRSLTLGVSFSSASILVNSVILCVFYYQASCGKRFSRTRN